MKVNKDKMDAYLKRIKAPVCPLCNNNEWKITDQVFQAIEFDYKGILIGGAAYPIVPLTCAHCGNTYFINALVAGLIDKDPPKNEINDNSSSTSK